MSGIGGGGAFGQTIHVLDDKHLTELNKIARRQPLVVGHLGRLGHERVEQEQQKVKRFDQLLLLLLLLLVLLR